jgi:hypothetical protein
MRRPDEPAASVVVVSDFDSGTERGWDDLRRTLTALARQDFTEPVDYVLVESDEYAERLPADLRTILPELRVVFTPSRDSYGLRNDGVRAARAELVGTIDGDCIPDPDWLRRLVDALRARPDAAAVSGRTVYPGSGFRVRAASLLERSFVEEGSGAPMRHVSNNGAGFRRTAYLAHPLPTELGVFASQVQSEAMLRPATRSSSTRACGHARLLPGVRRRPSPRIGYGVIRVRQHDGRLPYARLARLSWLDPDLLLARTARALGTRAPLPSPLRAPLVGGPRGPRPRGRGLRRRDPRHAARGARRSAARDAVPLSDADQDAGAFRRSRSRSSTRRILPLRVFGSSSTNSISRGYL